MGAALEWLAYILCADLFVVTGRAKKTAGTNIVRTGVSLCAGVTIVAARQVRYVDASCAVQADVVRAWVSIVARGSLGSRQALSKLARVTGRAGVSILAGAAVRDMCAIA